MTSLPYTDAELIELAKAATPGPWCAVGSVVCEIIEHGSNAFDEEPTAELSKLADTNESDAAFIAAFNPETALSLLSRIAAREAVNKELREALPQPTGLHWLGDMQRERHGCVAYFADEAQCLAFIEALTRRAAKAGGNT